MLFILFISFSPSLCKTSHEIHLYNKGKSNNFDKMDDTVSLLAQLRKLYVNLNEHYILKKRNKMG